MPDQEQRPVVPTRIIPAGEHLPPEVLADALRPPPRRARPPASPPPPPVDDRAWEWQPPAPSGPVEVHVTVDLAPAAEPEQDELGIWSRAWDWAATRVRPWMLLLALAGAVIPIPWTGYSVGTTWAATVGQARELGTGWGYALAFGTFALACLRFIRTGHLLPLFFLVVTSIGLFGAIDLFDPVTWLTGVHPK